MSSNFPGLSPRNINRHGLSGLVVRLDDKLARLGHSLTDHPDETCYDTLVDVVGYGIIGLMWIHNWWGLPLGDDNRPD